jgi:ABC-type dipeptide/oligopeptide/nickel transport system permease component
MGTYIVRRLLLLVPILFGISVAAFGLVRLAPDPARGYAARVHNNPNPGDAEILSIRHELGLDRPLAEQYATWVGQAVRGRFGSSYTTLQPVRTEFAHRLPVTLELAVPSVVLALLLGVPLGIIAAVHRGRAVDQLLRLACLGGASMPGFWLAILLINLFSVRLHLLPIVYAEGSGSIVLPTLTLALPMSAWLARFTRSSMLQTMDEDYVRTAAAKGVPRQLVMERHVLRNALVPLITVLGGTVARLLAGAAIIETIFAWPGLGAFSVQAVTASDFPVIQAMVVYTGTLFVLINVVVDVAYVAIDPRIRLSPQAPP